MLAKARSDAGAKETVLLVQAKPKYNFNACKLPKDASESKNSHSVLSEAKFSSHLACTSKPKARDSLPQKSDSQKTKPVAIVGASLQSSHLDRDTKIGIPSHSSTGSSQSYQPSVSASTISSGSTMLQNLHRKDLKVDQSMASSSDLYPSPNLLVISSPTASYSPPQSADEHLFSSLHFPGQTCKTLVLPSMSVCEDQCNRVTRSEITRSDDHIKSLEKERDTLKTDLDVQLQVNAALKRLLVASVGEDLCERVERLCRDRAQLSLDLGGYSKKLSEDYENLDKVSIQADIWRSKYLAARVMIEELGNARAYYALQCHDSQDALQQLLNERHELRTNLLETYKVLQQVKNAFDPLNSHHSSTLRSTNILDLSRSGQQLAEAIKFRLLPTNVAISIDVEGEDQLWAASVTRAEQFAHEVLSRPAEPSGSLQSGSSRLVPVTVSHSSLMPRFHPHTRDENLTYNCCAQCKGEISVI